MVQSMPSRYIPSNKMTPMIAWLRKKKEREGDPEDTNTIAYIEERREMPLLDQKDITVVSNSGSNKDDEGIAWLAVEEPLDSVDTSEESAYESLIKEMPKCSLNYDFRIKKGDPRNLKISCMIGKHFCAGIDLAALNSISSSYDDVPSDRGRSGMMLKDNGDGHSCSMGPSLTCA
ncbi:hypothetical protein Tco_0387359 [Tanacetum coccineum]